jgi:hypothetical protein
MILPSESLGVVAYAASDLRVEPIPLREPAANEAVVEVAYGGRRWSWVTRSSAPWLNRQATAAARSRHLGGGPSGHPCRRRRYTVPG